MADEQTGSILLLQDHVLVETDVLSRLVSLRTVIVKACPGELWLGLPSADRRLGAFRAGQPLRLTVARDGAALLGSSTFRATLGDTRSRIFAVSTPAEFQLVQRRCHRRYELDAGVRLRHLDPTTKEPLGRSASGVAVNVSLGGMMLWTSATLAVGEELDLTLPLGGGDHISTTNRVVRVRPLGPALSRVPAQDPPAVVEVGARFTRITAVDRNMLIRLALAAERRRRAADGVPGAFAS